MDRMVKEVWYRAPGFHTPTGSPLDQQIDIEGTKTFESGTLQHGLIACVEVMHQTEAARAEAERVARLIATAPELLAACRAFHSVWAAYEADDGSVNPHDYPIYEGINAIRAAIAKAEGGDA
jgi:hypothetical protein